MNLNYLNNLNKWNPKSDTKTRHKSLLGCVGKYKLNLLKKTCGAICCGKQMWNRSSSKYLYLNKLQSRVSCYQEYAIFLSNKAPKNFFLEICFSFYWGRNYSQHHLHEQKVEAEPDCTKQQLHLHKTSSQSVFMNRSKAGFKFNRPVFFLSSFPPLWKTSPSDCSPLQSDSTHSSPFHIVKAAEWYKKQVKKIIFLKHHIHKIDREVKVTDISCEIFNRYTYSINSRWDPSKQGSVRGLFTTPLQLTFSKRCV